MTLNPFLTMCSHDLSILLYSLNSKEIAALHIYRLRIDSTRVTFSLFVLLTLGSLTAFCKC